MNLDDVFELKATDLRGRIGNVRTKTSDLETPALLPVIHPVRQLIPCSEIGSLGYKAVMTNAYTTYRQLRERAKEGIHRIIGFDGTVMTDSGGYQVLEFGSVDIQPEEMARFQEKIGSDIAIVLDRPTGLDVKRKFASYTVKETLAAAKRTRRVASRDDIIWTLPIQGGRFIDLVSKSAKSSAELGFFGCYALGSPVEVMEEYDFSLLVKMIIASKKHLPANRPFHLFGAGHPLILPLAIALGCDMFDSASYMLYAKQDRYISTVGTIRLAQLEYLGCACNVCTSMTASELRSMPKEERMVSLARHNLAILKQVIEETKQAIWEGRLWEYTQMVAEKHPKTLEAFRTALSAGQKKDTKDIFEIGTPVFKDRGLFIFEKIDLQRPEIQRFRQKLKSIDLSQRRALFILPETRTKPFLKSKIFEEVARIASEKLDRILVASMCPNFGLVPAELSDIYPLSQYTNSCVEFPSNDPILNFKKWDTITILLRRENREKEVEWLRAEIARYFQTPREEFDLIRKMSRTNKVHEKIKAQIKIARSYREFKLNVKDALSRID